MSENVKDLAEKLVELEVQRKTITDEQKLLKDELLQLMEENDERIIECQNGIVALDTTTTWKVSDGLEEATEVKSKDVKQLSPDFLEAYFNPDLKLSKRAKQELKKGNSELASCLYEDTKTKVKVVVR